MFTVYFKQQKHVDTQSTHEPFFTAICMLLYSNPISIARSVTQQAQRNPNGASKVVAQLIARNRFHSLGRSARPRAAAVFVSVNKIIIASLLNCRVDDFCRFVGPPERVPMGRSEIALACVYKRVQQVSRTSFFRQRFATPVVNSESFNLPIKSETKKKKLKWQALKE